MAERDYNRDTMDRLDELEQCALRNITELIDGNHLEEACQIADILAKVGLI